MKAKHIAQQSLAIKAPVAAVWDALVNPVMIKQYLFGTTAISDWKEGSTILFTGEWEGKHYEDKGVILRLEPGRLLQYSYFSPLSGRPDTPENYQTITIEIAPRGTGTSLSLSQDNNATEEAREHSEKNWGMVLEGLRKLLEK
ncbi:MAG TPA: SRPBCC family protein [Bacteroidota bacterium]|nr:SRPBCC family protein [Bacteroidota bacterium]